MTLVSVNRVLLGLNMITGLIKNAVKREYYGCMGQKGTIIVPIILLIIFLNVCRMSAKGGKA